MSDTTNVMKGVRSDVQNFIKEGMKTLPVDIDLLFIDVFYYFHHSSKRKQDFCLWMSLFYFRAYHYITTRWLSLLRCVNRYLAQLDGSESYFLSCDDAETSKAQGILDKLQNPLIKLILCFAF